VKGTVEVEVSYAITSLSPDEANAERLLVFVRDHWTIENQLHSVRDVTLGADACRVRTGSAPRCWRRYGTPSCTCSPECPPTATRPPSNTCK